MDQQENAIWNQNFFFKWLQDREIDGLNEQLEEDSRCLEHLQIQLLEERSKRADVERQNTMLQNQISMLMDMLQDNEADENVDDGDAEPWTIVPFFPLLSFV